MCPVRLVWQAYVLTLVCNKIRDDRGFFSSYDGAQRRDVAVSTGGPGQFTSGFSWRALSEQALMLTRPAVQVSSRYVLEQ